MLFVLWLLIALGQSAQAQDVSLKTNAVYWATTTPNLGLEVALSPKYTVNLLGAYNPWTFKDDKKMRMWFVQPEVRYWLCEKFEGHYVGVHLHGAQYFGGFHEKRYDGYLAGGGISYGYNWILSPHWNLECYGSFGAVWYDQKHYYDKDNYQENRRTGSGYALIPFKIGVSFSYILK